MPVWRIPTWMYVRADTAELAETAMREYYQGAEYAGENMESGFLALIEEARLDEYELMSPEHPSWENWMEDEDDQSGDGATTP